MKKLWSGWTRNVNIQSGSWQDQEGKEVRHHQEVEDCERSDPADAGIIRNVAHNADVRDCCLQADQSEEAAGGVEEAAYGIHELLLE